MKILLLTGTPGAGKTTVIRKIAAALPDWRLAGFYTEEIRDAGERRGFRIVGFDGQEKVMARENFPGPFRIGKYGVDVSAIEAVAESALSLDRPADLYLVDEIGRMECLSGKFIAAMRAVLDSGKPVIATVALHGEGFIAEVKSRPGVQLWQVTRGNRDYLPRDVLAWLKKQ
jgi:nucleoside-triphosphatase